MLGLSDAAEAKYTGSEIEVGSSSMYSNLPSNHFIRGIVLSETNGYHLGPAVGTPGAQTGRGRREIVKATQL